MPRNFSNWLKEYINYTQFSEAPDVFHFWTGVATIAGALQRRVWIDERYWQWTPNFYIIFVAPPGIATKSTAVATGMHLLRAIDDVQFGPNSLTWQGLTLALEESRQFLTLPDGRFQPMSCLTCALSELGTFLKTDDGDLVDILTEMWDGQLVEWRHKTRTMAEIKIQNPWLNIIGCTTPAWLRDNLSRSLIESGFTSRVVFVFANKKRRLVPYPSRLIEEGAYSDHAKRLVHDLQQIALLQGPFTLTPEAIKWGEEWYDKVWTDSRYTKTERYEGYRARKQTHIHKLAMVLSAAQRDNLTIEAADLINADRIVTALEQGLAVVFREVGASERGQLTAHILAYIRARDSGVPFAELAKTFMLQADARTLDGAIVTLLNARLIARVVVDNQLAFKAAKEVPERVPDTV